MGMLSSAYDHSFIVFLISSVISFLFRFFVIIKLFIICLEGKYVHSDVNIPYPINPHNSLPPGDDMDSGLTNATDKLTNDKQQFPSKGSFVYALPNGSVSYNKHIKAMIEVSVYFDEFNV